MPLSGSTLTGFWGTVRTMTGTPIFGVVQLLHELHPAQPALEQGVDDDHVRAVLGDPLGNDRAVGDDVDEPHLALGVQQASDVLRDLGYVLDEEQANLVTRCHRRNGTTGTRSIRTRSGGPGLRAKSTARSLPGDIAPSS